MQNPKVNQNSNGSMQSQIDLELEALRNEVLNCGNSSVTGDNENNESNKHSIKAMAVGTVFMLVLKVSENFGVDLTSAKEHPNKELQEDLRSLSRTMMQDSEYDIASQAEEGKALETGNINEMQFQKGQFEMKNSQSQNNINEDNKSRERQPNSRNLNKQKSFLQKAVQDQPSLSRNQIEIQQRQAQSNVEKIFKRAFQQIVQGLKFYAWPLFRIPQSNNLIPLMNSSFIFQNNNHLEEKRDLDFLIALSLMSGRKFIQASEQFRKLQNELLLNSNNYTNQSCIEKSIQLEILIADSMNQHSQLSEKIFAYQRAVDLSLKKKVKPINQNHSHFVHQIREEEAYKMLMLMHPYLIKVLLQNIETKIEIVKTSVLRSIEFLLDQLGCSLDQNLIHILVAVINTYPRSNLHFNSGLVQSQKLPIRYGFYQQIHTINQNQSNNNWGNNFNMKFDHAIENSYLDSILFDQNDQNDLAIKDGQNFQLSYQQSIKNLQNHILESFISLLSSMSSQVLLQIFNEVIQKTVFLGNNPLDNQLATDLRIYLLKFADKIINICQGDLILSNNFLNQIVATMIPDQRKLQQAILGQVGLGQSNQADVVKAKQKTSETISLACHNLWQTFRQKLFVNYSSKGLKSLLEWIFNNLVNLAEHSESLAQDEQQRLTLVFDIIDLIAQQQTIQNESQKSYENSGDVLDEQIKRLDNHQQQVHSLTGRDSLRNASRMGEQTNINTNIAIDPNTSQNYKQQPLIKVKTRSIASLELYALINPVLFWLDYSIEKPDRLSLFKIIWKTLNRILGSLPNKQIDVDAVQIIMPVLIKVNQFCQTSSPPQEMLQFLSVVLQDFSKSKKISKELTKFLDSFLITIAKCIPHNLHEEIFMVCELNLEIMKENLKQEHVNAVIDALIDKYTMRSKAHKRLQQYFVNLILEQSQKKLNQVQIENQQRNTNPFQQQEMLNNMRGNNFYSSGIIQPQMNQIHHQNSQQNQQYMSQGHINPGPHQQHEEDFIDNYEYERESNTENYLEEDYDEQSDNDHHNQDFIRHNQNIHLRQQQFAQQNTNQDYNESPISQRIIHQSINQLQLSQQMSQQYANHMNPQQIRSVMQVRNDQISDQTYFDHAIEFCLYKNQYEKIQGDKHKDLINLELYFEKIHLFQQLIKSLSQQQINLFQKLLNREGFKDVMIKILTNERSTLNAIELIEQLSSYYMTNCAPKNLYEHPLSIINNFNVGDQQQFLRNNNNNQTSQSSGHQQQFVQPITNRAGGGSSRNSFISNTNNNNLSNSAQNIQFRNNLHNLGQQMNQNMVQQVTAHQRQQQFQMEDELMIDNLNDDCIHDEVDIINKERLILIQIYAVFIRTSIEQFSQSHDSYLQFHTLNMMDNLFSNLMPVPSFQNMMIKQYLQRQRYQFNQMNNEIQGIIGQQNSQVKVHHHEIPDLERFQILENYQNYIQMLQQQQHLASQQQQSYIFSESSWSNIRSICYGVFCQILRIDISEFKQSFANKIKQLLFPLLNNLLFSKESESKAGGLNILGSFCGLGQDFSQVSSHLKVQENISQFRKNSNFISLALWQQVFNLQEDWDPTIREAASVLIQVCAPRESIKHFNSILLEKFHLKLQSMIKTFKASANIQMRNKQYLGLQSNCQTPLGFQNNSIQQEEEQKRLDENGEIERASPRQQRQSIFKSYVQNTQSIRANLGSSMAMSQLDFHNNFSDNEEEKNSNASSNSGERVRNMNYQNLADSFEDYFYVDNYSEQQIKEIISIFKNDYKPPKNLWIEKNGINNYQNNNLPNNEVIDLANQGYQDGDNPDQNLIDIFEDRIVDKLNKMSMAKSSENLSSISHVLDQYFKKSNDTETSVTVSANATGDSEYLIFERHFESDKDKIAQSSVTITDTKKEQNNIDGNLNIIDGLNQEDLGIIDLDDDEGGDDFDELDDDKLPVLKNTYSKKNRPNNSKSVAIGSRTQELNQQKSRSQQKNYKESEISCQRVQEVIEPQKKSNTTEDSKQNEVDDRVHQIVRNNLPQFSETNPSLKDQSQSGVKDAQAQDEIIEEYEHMIAQTIQDLNDRLKTQEIKSPKKIEILKPDEFIQSPQAFQLAATIKINRRNDDQRLFKEKSKTNKSFEMKQRKVGLHSPVKTKDSYQTHAPSLVLNDIHLELEKSTNQALLSQIASSAGSLSASNQIQVKKINDPLIAKTQKTYLSQAQKSKNLCNQINQSHLGNLKKEQSLPQKPLVLSNTSPGPIPSAIFVNPTVAKPSSQSTKSNNSFQNNLQSQTSLTTNTRKRKSEHQRKSDVPPYQSLAQKKITTSSLSQINTINTNLNNSNQNVQSSNNSSFNQIANTLSNQIKKSSQATLMQQAKQAFVSRAKSQSYLNNVFAAGSINSGNSTNNNQTQPKTKKPNRNNLKQSSQSFSNSIQNTLTGNSFVKGRVGGIMKITHDDSSSGSNGNSACSGGIMTNNLVQIHKGYFSNDECDKSEGVAQKVNSKIIRTLMSPPRSGDLQKKSKKQSFSSDEQDVHQVRASSNQMKRKNKRMQPVMITSDEADDIELKGFNSIDQQAKANKPKRKTKRFISKESPVATQISINQINTSQEIKNSTDIIQQEEFKHPEEIYDDQENEEPEDDIEEFTSGDSARGSGLVVKQLSSIDEEEDMSERRIGGRSSLKDNFSLSSSGISSNQ